MSHLGKTALRVNSGTASANGAFPLRCLPARCSLLHRLSFSLPPIVKGAGAFKGGKGGGLRIRCESFQYLDGRGEHRRRGNANRPIRLFPAATAADVLIRSSIWPRRRVIASEKEACFELKSNTHVPPGGAKTATVLDCTVLYMHLG